MTVDYKSRWMTDNNLIKRIKNNNQGTEHKYVDLKGLPFGNKTTRKGLEKINFKFVDFSYSDFEECNFIDLTFSSCIFFKVDFSELRQWNCKYNNCTFDQSTFSNATLGLNSTFSDCTFINSKFKGKHFDFGKFNVFENCHFINCDISSTWIISITFNNCNFESKFSNVRFSGSQEVEALNKMEKGHFPVRLINCNLEKSIFNEVEIMDGVTLQLTTLPRQNSRRFNNDRTYYTTDPE